MRSPCHVRHIAALGIALMPGEKVTRPDAQRIGHAMSRWKKGVKMLSLAVPQSFKKTLTGRFG